eukprot:2026382-Rhodomonas_salina.2
MQGERAHVAVEDGRADLTDELDVAERHVLDLALRRHQRDLPLNDAIAARKVRTASTPHNLRAAASEPDRGTESCERGKRECGVPASVLCDAGCRFSH